MRNIVAHDYANVDLRIVWEVATAYPLMTPRRLRLLCVHFRHMGLTLTIRLSKELAAWLETTAAKSGVSQGKLVRDQLEKARASNGAQAFMRLAGTVRGSKDLSSRKGFSRS